MIRQFFFGADQRKSGMAVFTVLLAALALLWIPGAHAQQVTRTQLTMSAANGKITLVAQVSDLESNPLNSGSVSFDTTKGSLGSAFVQNGSASLTLDSIPAGAGQVVAVYHAATSDYAASLSAPAAVSSDDNSTVASFNVTADPSSLTITPGQYETVELSLNSVNGFAGVVNLSCSFLPNTLGQEASCNFTPSVLTLKANTTSTSSMQVLTYAASGVSTSSKAQSPFGHSHLYLAMILPGSFALFGVFALRRKNGSALRMLGMVALLAVCAASLTACSQRYGYLKHKPLPNPGTPTGTYSLVVSAYSSNGTTIQNATSSSGCSGAVCIAMTVK